MLKGNANRLIELAGTVAWTRRRRTLDGRGTLTAVGPRGHSLWMNEEETERLIVELRDMLFRKGFGWAAVEAEESLYPTVTTRTRAVALINAAEIVTVDLAAVEMAADDMLGGEGIRFKPDEVDRDNDDDAFALRDRAAADFETGSLFGPQRRAVLAGLSARREVFTVLRSRLDGLV